MMREPILFRGTIYLPSDVLHFTPIEEGGFTHALYRETKAANSSCGNPHTDFFHRSITGSLHYNLKKSIGP